MVCHDRKAKKRLMHAFIDFALVIYLFSHHLILSSYQFEKRFPGELFKV
jgi:hypothetical protein